MKRRLLNERNYTLHVSQMRLVSTTVKSDLFLILLKGNSQIWFQTPDPRA